MTKLMDGSYKSMGDELEYEYPRGMSADAAAGKEEWWQYRSRKCPNKVYEYTARCSVTGDTLHWEATVRCEGELKGKPGGDISVTKALDPRAFVLSRVEHCIENQVGVRS